MPALTRRSRILLGIAVAVVAVLLVGPRFIDTYVDWLWFRRARLPLGVHHRAVHPAGGLPGDRVRVRGHRLCGPGAGLPHPPGVRPDHRPQRPGGPLPVGRHGQAAGLRPGHPAIVGVLAGLVAQSYWPRVQLFLHGGSFGIADPQFGKDLGFYAFQLPFYRLLLSFLFVALFLAFLANLVTHYIFGGIRLSAGVGAGQPRGPHPADLPARRAGVAEGGGVLAGPRTAQPHPAGQAVHRRRLLHRHQRRAAGQAHPAGHRRHLRGPRCSPALVLRDLRIPAIGWCCCSSVR